MKLLCILVNYVSPETGKVTRLLELSHLDARDSSRASSRVLGFPDCRVPEPRRAERESGQSNDPGMRGDTRPDGRSGLLKLRYCPCHVAALKYTSLITSGIHTCESVIVDILTCKSHAEGPITRQQRGASEKSTRAKGSPRLFNVYLQEAPPSLAAPDREGVLEFKEQKPFQRLGACTSDDSTAHGGVKHPRIGDHHGPKYKGSERVVWLGCGYVLNCHKQKQLKYSFFHEYCMVSTGGKGHNRTG
ncbi:hypothetical protein MTP99_015969 [Tenebrio molitor]|nr:hypothetical protein MTP99_015969 [Tenebrio molitor]